MLSCVGAVVRACVRGRHIDPGAKGKDHNGHTRAIRTTGAKAHKDREGGGEAARAAAATTGMTMAMTATRTADRGWVLRRGPATRSERLDIGYYASNSSQLVNT